MTVNKSIYTIFVVNKRVFSSFDIRLFFNYVPSYLFFCDFDTCLAPLFSGFLKPLLYTYTFYIINLIAYDASGLFFYILFFVIIYSNNNNVYRPGTTAYYFALFVVHLSARRFNYF